MKCRFSVIKNSIGIVNNAKYLKKNNITKSVLKQ
jgi:hypothetical protein